MRKIRGTIVSAKMRNTAVVRVDRLKKHPKYLKYVRMSKGFKADSAGGDYKPGDIVTIQETRPISKQKRWKIVELVKKRSEVEEVDTPDVQEIQNSKIKVKN